jgi:chaperonin GroES
MVLNIKPFQTEFLSNPLLLNKTASGFLFQIQQKKTTKKEPLCCWKRNKRTPNDCENWRFCSYGKYAGTELKLEGKDYLIMREDDILVII